MKPRFSPEQIHTIVRDPRLYREIAAEYGVTSTTIGLIKRGESYATIDDRSELVISRCGRHHLTDAEVRQIITDPRRYIDIAVAFKVSSSTVSLIKKGLAYKHVPDRPKPVLRCLHRPGHSPFSKSVVAFING